MPIEPDRIAYNIRMSNRLSEDDKLSDIVSRLYELQDIVVELAREVAELRKAKD